MAECTELRRLLRIEPGALGRGLLHRFDRTAGEAALASAGVRALIACASDCGTEEFCAALRTEGVDADGWFDGPVIDRVARGGEVTGDGSYFERLAAAAPRLAVRLRYEQLGALVLAGEIGALRNWRIIHLQRASPLREAIHSRLRAVGPAAGYDFEDLLRRLDHAIHTGANWERLFALLRLTPLRLGVEEVESAPAAAAARAAQFIATGESRAAPQRPDAESAGPQVLDWERRFTAEASERVGEAAVAAAARADLLLSAASGGAGGRAEAIAALEDPARREAEAREAMRLLADVGDLAESARCAAIVLELRPGDPNASVYIAGHMLGCGALVKARRRICAIDHDALSLPSLARVAALAAQAGADEAARAAVEALTRRFPSHPAGYRLSLSLAPLRADTKRHLRRAVEALEAGLVGGPDLALEIYAAALHADASATMRDRARSALQREAAEAEGTEAWSSRLERLEADHRAARIAELRERMRREAEAGDLAAAAGSAGLLLELAPGDDNARFYRIEEEARRAGPEAAAALATIDREKVSFPTLARAVRLLADLDEPAAAVEWLRACVRRFPANPFGYHGFFSIPELRAHLTEGADLTAEALASGAVRDPALCLGYLRALRRLGASADETARGRELVERALGEQAATPLWRARLLECDGDAEGALAELQAHLSAAPGEREAVRLAGAIALRSGRWGRHAALLRDLEAVSAPNEQVAFMLDSARSLFAEYGRSFAEVAETGRDAARLASPEAACELAARRPPPCEGGERSGLAMVCGSLTLGGAERVVANLYRRFRRMELLGGVDLCLFQKSGLGGKDPLFYLPLAGAAADEIHEVAASSPPAAPFRYLPPWMAEKAQGLFERFAATRPLAVHASLDHANITAGLAAIEAGVPRIVLHVHNIRPTTLVEEPEVFRGFDAAYRHLLSRPEVTLVACAEAARRDYLDWMGLKEAANAVVVRNGYDFDEFRPASSRQRAAFRAEIGAPQEAPLVGTAIRFRAVKQPELWLDAARLIRDWAPEAHFVMYGEGDLLDSAARHAARIGLAEAVSFPGRRTDILPRISDFDLFMLSSASEGLPNVLIEAQALGVPVVSTAVGGVAETMAPGVTGRIAAPGDARALAAEAILALRSESWMANARRRGPEFVRSRFDLDTAAADMARLISAPRLPAASGRPPRAETV